MDQLSHGQAEALAVGSGWGCRAESSLGVAAAETAARATEAPPGSPRTSNGYSETPYAPRAPTPNATVGAGAPGPTPRALYHLTKVTATLRPCQHQVAGHLFEEGKAGSLVDDFGHFYKPLQPGPRGDRERAFYELVAEELQAEREGRAAAAGAPAGDAARAAAAGSGPAPPLDDAGAPAAALPAAATPVAPPPPSLHAASGGVAQRDAVGLVPLPSSLWDRADASDEDWGSDSSGHGSDCETHATAAHVMASARGRAQNEAGASASGGIAPDVRPPALGGSDQPGGAPAGSPPPCATSARPRPLRGAAPAPVLPPGARATAASAPASPAPRVAQPHPRRPFSGAPRPLLHSLSSPAARVALPKPGSPPPVGASPPRPVRVPASPLDAPRGDPSVPNGGDPPGRDRGAAGAPRPRSGGAPEPTPAGTPPATPLSPSFSPRAAARRAWASEEEGVSGARARRAYEGLAARVAAAFAGRPRGASDTGEGETSSEEEHAARLAERRKRSGLGRGASVDAPSPSHLPAQVLPAGAAGQGRAAPPTQHSPRPHQTLSRGGATGDPPVAAAVAGPVAPQSPLAATTPAAQPSDEGADGDDETEAWDDAGKAAGAGKATGPAAAAETVAAATTTTTSAVTTTVEAGGTAAAAATSEPGAAARLPRARSRSIHRRSSRRGSRPPRGPPPFQWNRSDPFSVRSAPLLAVVPRFHGVHLSEGRILAELDDATRRYRHPCIADVKIGYRTWYRESNDESYIERCRRKDRATTQASLGFKICGIQVWRAESGGYWRASKRWCKTLPEDVVDKVLLSFADNELGLSADAVYGGASGAVAQLRRLERWVAAQREFRFYSSSVLLLYEGDASGPDDANVAVRLVDFAHSFRADDGLRDHNFLAGLRSLVARLRRVARAAASAASASSALAARAPFPPPPVAAPPAATAHAPAAPPTTPAHAPTAPTAAPSLPAIRARTPTPRASPLSPLSPLPGTLVPGPGPSDPEAVAVAGGLAAVTASLALRPAASELPSDGLAGNPSRIAPAPGPIPPTDG